MKPVILVAVPMPLGFAVALCVASSVAFFPQLVHAQQSQAQGAAPDLVTLGRQEFEAAQTEFNLGHYEKSLEHFETSYRLTGKAALLYNIGFVDKQLFERTRKIEYLQQAIERFSAYLANTKADADPKVTAQRGRAQKELADAQSKLGIEQAARAEGEESLRLGEELAARGKLEEATAQLERYEKTPANERAGVVRACVLRATVAAALEHEETATQGWVCALSLDRTAAPAAAASPSLKKAYAAAVEKLGGAPTLSVGHTPPASLKLNSAVALTFVVASDPAAMIKGVKLAYRAGGGAYSRLPLAPVGKIVLPTSFSAGLLPGATVEYYAEIIGTNEAVLEHLGSPTLPFSVKVEQASKRVATWKWLTGAAAVVVAGGTALGIGLYLSQPPPRMQVPLDFALRPGLW